VVAPVTASTTGPATAALPAAPPVVSSTIGGDPLAVAPPLTATRIAQPPPPPAVRTVPVTRTMTAAPDLPPVPYEELHKRTQLVILPTGYAAHMRGTTGENAEIFMNWWIGTFYDERGLSIAPISTLIIGADLKYSFLADKGGIPAAAIGYFGGFALPFAGGAVRAGDLAKQRGIKQTFVHNASLALSKRVGPVSFTVGMLYGFKAAYPVILPMLRNPSFSTMSNPSTSEYISVYGGFDLVLGSRHIKVEALTIPAEPEHPWMIHSKVDQFLGFDLAFIKDRIGYEIVGYYLLPFYRWPDKKRLEKERDRQAARKKRGGP
jgi:hypothetical protein